MGKNLDAANKQIRDLREQLDLVMAAGNEAMKDRDACLEEVITLTARIEVLQSEAQKLRARPAPRKAAPRKNAVKKGGE